MVVPAQVLAQAVQHRSCNEVEGLTTSHHLLQIVQFYQVTHDCFPYSLVVCHAPFFVPCIAAWLLFRVPVVGHHQDPLVTSSRAIYRP
jgi:hypothetical protein